ncbi:M28 family metallopeptidase [Phenylobacterium sp.]|uniref:M28 family metallopeptidase n=1 Tax=Phenylobacterium sp. TaxID=1871053 RepID=UPI00286C1001|nr:M28 family metallopeptidase [Phenylobacterium sp.]
MRLSLVLCAALVASPVLAAAPPTAEARWWGHVETLAGPEFEGRLTGSPGHAKAAAYAAGRFKAYGLQPAGTDGFLQPVTFAVQRIDAARSSVALVSGSETTPVAVGPDIILGARIPQLPTVDAPLVFIGYGLHLPEIGVDDFAGQDLKGKIAVYINGGPQEISAALKSHSRGTQTWRAASAAGAIGLIGLSSPKTAEIPWERTIENSIQPGMYPADPTLQDAGAPKFSATFNPAMAEKLFARSGHSFAEVVALADAAKPMTGFDLKLGLKANVAASVSAVTSQNVVAKLPGSDPRLAAEHVVITAHIDHLGLNETGKGAPYYPGAMDNASGVATVLEVARQMAAAKVKPKRSVLFVLVTAEEKGLLGSKYFAERPSVPKGSVVADLNMDMALPLWPLTSVIVLGVDESTLGEAARAAAASRGLEVVADPYPDRNSFIRSDQYSFIRVGVPALAFKFGFKPGTPEAAIEKAWRSDRYHGLADDLSQPVERAEAVKFNAYMAAVALQVANAPQRPAWKDTSFFKRFAD